MMGTERVKDKNDNTCTNFDENTAGRILDVFNDQDPYIFKIIIKPDEYEVPGENS